MKKTFFLALLGLAYLAPQNAQAEDVLMPQFGKQVLVVSADQPITFYDHKGTGNLAGSNADNSFATTIFKPATMGQAVSITFSELDLQHDGDNYPAKLMVYNGVFDTTSVTYPTTVSGVTASSFPETDNLVATLEGTLSDINYISTSPDGALSLCFHYRYPKLSKGWVATVTTVEVKPMQVTSATADYTTVLPEIYAGASNRCLGGLRIATEGISDADVLTSLTFTLDQTGVYDPTQLTLYQGLASDVSTLHPIEATLTNQGNSYTFTLSQPLASGENTFCIGASVLGSAPFDATSTLTFTGLTTANGFNTLTPATPVQQTVQPMVLMQNGQNVTVQVDRAINFYDDGGPEGKISNNFEGTVTFLPTTPGKKVQLDMQNISLFYIASAVSVGNQDVLSIYSGTTVDADHLLYTVATDKLASLNIKSPSEDGALTVYLRSKTPSDYYKGSGFEAVVSEFTPAPMTVASSAVDKQTGETAACTQGVQFLHFCLNTENTEPALAPTAFRFNTANTFALLEGATLYYTGNSNTFSTTRKVGETTITGNEFTIPASELTLREGENHFFLTVDVACTAQNAQTLTANIAQVDFSNATNYTAFTNPEGAFTIQNTLLSTCGTRTINLHGDWLFTHTPASQWSSDYKAEECDQITTFRPTQEGYIAQIDFADFDVYYASSSYGVHATFQIYAGTSTSGELLWEANADNCKVGPGLVRSTSEDGALTILFNPNTTSYYTKAGWHATVSEYMPTPMVVENTAITTLSQATLVRGQQNAEWLAIDITTTGLLEPLALTEVALQLTGHEAVSALHLLQGEEVIATVEVTSAEVQFTANQQLKEGDNTLRLLLDVASDAAFETEVAATISSLVVGGQTFQPTTPENTRVVRNIYCLETDHHQVEVGNTPLSFFDDGGQEGKITQGFSGSVTFIPTVPNSAISLRFRSWDLNGSDNFYVYYADDVQDQHDLLLSRYTDNIDQLVLISEAASGALTVRFSTPSYATPGNGWEIEVSCHELQPLVADSVVVSSVSPGVATTGSANLPMLRMAVHVSGDRGPIAVENFVINTTGDAENPQIYQTGTVATFSTNTPFNVVDSIRTRGTHYYWTTLDIPATAQTESNVTTSLTTVDINHVPTAPKYAVTANLQIISGMHGIYRIGTGEGTDFQTIQAAIDALEIGIDGPVTFLIEPGTYTERLTLPEIAGASATNTLTFRSSTDNPSDVIIEHNSYSSSYGVEYGVFTIEGADYVQLSNLTLCTTAGQYDAVVYVRDNAHHVTIDHCYIHAPISMVSNTSDICLVKTKGGDTENTNPDYFTLSHSTLEGGYVSVYIGGAGTVNIPQEIGTQILSNTISGYGNQGIYFVRERQGIIDGNTIRNTETTKTSTRAIDVTFYEGCSISNNLIDIDLDVHSDAIYLRQLDGTEDAPVRIYNNVISLASQGTSLSVGIRFNRLTTHTSVAHNTIRVSSSTPETAVLRPIHIGTSRNYTHTHLQVVNNIFQNEATQYDAFFLGSTSGALTDCEFGHNALWSAGTVLANVVGSEVSTLEAYAEATGDNTSINEKAVFVGEDDLRLQAKGGFASAQPLDYITTDHNGIVRATTPTIGAYEFLEDYSTAVPEVSAEGEDTARKILRDGIILIERNGKLYNLQGQVVQ